MTWSVTPYVLHRASSGVGVDFRFPFTVARAAAHISVSVRLWIQYAIRMFVAGGMPVLTSQSFAKNFGLYNERVGTFSVVCASKARATDVLSQLELIVRANYSVRVHFILMR